MSRRLALLIGNVYYQDGRLHAPVSGKEFTALADRLENEQEGRFDEVFVLVNKPAVEVQLALAEFFDQSRSPDDLLLIYFAGHILYHQEKPLLTCGDTFTSTYLDASTIQAEYMRRRLSLCQAAQKLIVLDATVSPLQPDGTLPEDSHWLTGAFAGADTAVLAASQPADADPSPIHSQFTPALAAGLQAGAADADGDGLITVGEWFDFAQSQADPAQNCQITGRELAAGLVMGAAPTHKGAVPLVLPPPATAVPATSTSRRNWVIAGLTLLVLLLLAGGVYGSGLINGTVAPTSPPVVPTTAVAALLPTATATDTAQPPTATATKTATATPTATSKPGNKNTATPEGAVTTTATADAGTQTTPVTGTVEATNAPTSATTTVTPSLSPLGVHVVRQLIYMRSGPAINFRILDYLPEGTAVTVLGRTESGEWYNIQLDDGRTGWVYSEMVASPAEASPTEIPLVGTIPAAANEFYNFVAQPTDNGLTITVGHVYIGTEGPDATFQATLVPGTSLIQLTYENGQELGLGDLVVHFARVGEEPPEYSSTAVKLCMVSPAGVEFYCQTFPLRYVWE